MKKLYKKINAPYNSKGIRIEEIPEQRPTIGISLSGTAVPRWLYDGAYLRKYLSDLGYNAEIQYAAENAIIQLSQIEDLLNGGVVGLIVAPVNPPFIQFILNLASENNIPVIAYDRLIMGTDAVDFYTSFNNATVGAMMGRYIEEKLGLKEGKGPYNIEFFAGSPDDNNAYVVGSATYTILEEYINNGQLEVPSDEVTFSQVWTINWSKEAAKERMSRLLQTYYQDRPLHAVASSSDSISSGIVEALEEAGYTPGDNWPIITGQDAEIDAVRRIAEGKQAMTVFKDVRVLAKKTAEIMDGLLKGEPIISDSFITVFNGVIMVPTYYVEPMVVDETNYREELFDSGYYTEEQIFGETTDTNQGI